MIIAGAGVEAGPTLPLSDVVRGGTWLSSTADHVGLVGEVVGDLADALAPVKAVLVDARLA